MTDAIWAPGDGGCWGEFGRPWVASDDDLYDDHDDYDDLFRT
jgi:hypothetical protein